MLIRQNQVFFLLLCIQLFIISMSSPLPILQENWSGWDVISDSGSSSSSSSASASCVNYSGFAETLKHYASLQANGRHKCAAVLLNKNIALVAAHCLYDEEKNRMEQWRLQIVGGVQSRDDSGPHTQIRTIQNILIHPNFNINTNTRENDIALIRVQGNGFNLNKHLHKVFVVSPRPQNFTGLTVVTSGFSGSRDKLKHCSTRVISNSRCNQMLMEENSRRSGNRVGVGIGVSSSMICTHVRAQSKVCPEDSGVPLIYKDRDGRNTLIGIVAREGGCATNGPTVFTRISQFEGWIQNKYNQLTQLTQ